MIIDRCKLKGLFKAAVCIFFMIFLLGATINAQSVSGNYGGEITVAISAEPVTLNVHTSPATVTTQVGGHIAEPLYGMNEKGNFLPVLAKEEAKWDDQKKEFIIKLHQGVKFHDGTEMTSKDVLASIKSWQAHASQASVFGEYVTELRDIDSYTIGISAKEEFAIEALLGYPSQICSIYPEELLEEGFHTPIGTGPYKVDEWVSGSHIALSRFDDYTVVGTGPATGFVGEKIPYFDKVTFRFVPEDATRLELLLAGQVDFADSLSSIHYDRLIDANNAMPIIVKPLWKPLWRFNFKVFPAGMDEKQALKFRQAIQAVLDHEALMKAATGGQEQFYRLNSCVIAYPEQIYWNDVMEDTYNQNNIEKAKLLLEESGYKGQPINVMIAKDLSWIYKPSLEFVYQLEEKLGLNINVETMNFTTILERRFEENRWDIFSEGNSITYHPLYWSSFWTGTRPGWFTTDRVKEICQLATKLRDEKELFKLGVELTEILEENVPEIHAGDFFEMRGASNKLQNLRANVRDFFFWSTWR